MVQIKWYRSRSNGTDQMVQEQINGADQMVQEQIKWYRSNGTGADQMLHVSNLITPKHHHMKT